VTEADTAGVLEKLSSEQQASGIAMLVVKNAIDYFENVRRRRWINVMETTIGQCAMPERELTDKILRYETTIEKSLGRALDRLERLQRRRRGELVLPPLRVILTQ
jgi:hypothetical protein